MGQTQVVCEGSGHEGTLVLARPPGIRRTSPGPGCVTYYPRGWCLAIDPTKEASMPSGINGLPLHPLVVHAVGVLVARTALIAVLFLVPRFRRSLRWPMVVLGLVSLVSTFVARQSGLNLKNSAYIPDNGPIFDAVQRHQHLANQLWYIVIAFFIVILIAAYVLRPDDELGPFPGRLGDSDDEEGATTL